MQKKYIFLVIFFSSILSVFSLSILSSNGNDRYPVYGKADIWEFSTKNVLVKNLSRFDSEYNNNARIIITRKNSATNHTVLNSQQYGDFQLQNNQEIIFSKASSNSRSCNNKLTYTVSGKVYSPDWGVELSILNNLQNYYCPETGAFSFELEDHPVDKKIGRIRVQNVTSDIVDITDRFDNKNISVRGITSVTTENQVDFDGELYNPDDLVIVNNTSSKFANLQKNIDKNIAKLTRGEEASTDSTTLVNFTDKKIYHYDFSGTVSGNNPSNEANEGKILQIGTAGNPDHTFNKMQVSGDRTIIVEGGNVYIATDIYNSSINPKSLLTIVVKRDKNNRKNGGNVYIHPYVTNIDAVIIAEGSLLSYKDNRVLSGDIETDVSNLRKQLYIYGALKSANTIGKSEVPYGSDGYIKDQNMSDPKYDLGNLRTFKPILNTETINCHYDPGNYTVALGKNFQQAETYGFAGKKPCYFGDDPQSLLRETLELAPVVIEYNPVIQFAPPGILRK